MAHVLIGLDSMLRGTATLLGGDGPWMVWNLLLAVVPAVFAIVLFRPGTRREPLWWAGVAVFVLFLFLGRVLRLNSWNVVTHPGSVVDALRATAAGLPVAIVVATFAALVVLTAACDPMLDAGIIRVRHLVDHLHPPA